MEVKQVIICNNCLSTHPDNDETIIGDTCENCEDGTMQHGTLFLAGTEPQAETVNNLITTKMRFVMHAAEKNSLVFMEDDPCPKCGNALTIDDSGEGPDINCPICGWALII